jgi:hypothetical protein
MENKPIIEKIKSIAELVMMMGKSTSDDEKRQLQEQIDKIRAQRASKPKPISKMTSMNDLVMKLEKGNPSEAEKLEIKQRLKKLRGDKCDKATDDATPTAEPSLAEKTMILRQYYAEKYGKKPVVNNTSKILDLIDDSCDLKSSPKNEWFSPTDTISSFGNSEEIPTDNKSILQQIDNDYEIIEIKINMRKKYKSPAAFCRP